MVRKETIIKNKEGFHIRPAQIFTNLSSKYESSVTLYNEKGVGADGKSLLGIMTLGLELGSKVIVETKGNDEEKALDELIELIDSKFSEN